MENETQRWEITYVVYCRRLDRKSRRATFAIHPDQTVLAVPQKAVRARVQRSIRSAENTLRAGMKFISWPQRPRASEGVIR